jgi:hypothetical protein
MNQEKEINDILEIVSLMRDNFATKDDLRNFATKDDITRLDGKIDGVKDDLQNFATKDDLKEMESRMIEHVDGFVALYQKHEVELAAVVSRVNRFEDKLDKVIKHLGLNLV